MTLIGKVYSSWQKNFRYILKVVFNFDKWHITPISSRNYAIGITRFLNESKNRNSIAEIGCGLGDILRKVRFKAKYGFDADVNVLKAARLLSLFQFPYVKTIFKKFTFPSDGLTGEYDAILLVNWIHHIEPAILKEMIRDYYINRLRHGGSIVIDTVDDPAYKYNHDIQFLVLDINCSLECIGAYERNRKVWAVKKM